MVFVSTHSATPIWSVEVLREIVSSIHATETVGFFGREDSTSAPRCMCIEFEFGVNGLGDPSDEKLRSMADALCCVDRYFLFADSREGGGSIACAVSTEWMLKAV